MARSNPTTAMDFATKAYQQVIKLEDLPQVSFRVVDEDEDEPSPFERRSKADKTQLPLPLLESFGYNVSEEDFKVDDHYIRHVEPIEVELANQVEYDMDEQDKEWLDVANEERYKAGLDRMSYELFEIVMDKLEKEWFNLVKMIPSKQSNLTNEDSKCAVCDDGEGENSNAIVFCDGCNLAVHQDCYGVPYIPEGQWLCRKCTVEPENPVDCIFCPNEGGAYKQTNKGAWAHLLCAIWIPEVGVSNSVYMEPIEGVESIPKSRWKLTCYVCKQKGGACIQCDTKTCFTAFHVTCARSHGLLGSMKSMNHDGVLRAQCHRHLPTSRLTNLEAEGEAGAEKTARLSELSYREEASTPSGAEKRSRKQKGGSTEVSLIEKSSMGPYLSIGKGTTTFMATAKSARAHAKSYTSGPPLVPGIIVSSILHYVQKVKLKRTRDYIEKICRYWSLKREARRGAPLLKRLYLEPWTASNQSKEQTDAEKAKRLEYLIQVRNDLERVRMLAELVRKREQEKLRQARIVKQFVEQSIFPFDAAMQAAFTNIAQMDRSELFMHPVPASEAPDYYDVIKEPMYWKAIERKLNEHSYTTLAEFLCDMALVLDNAILYNSHPGNIYHKLAIRIKKAAEPVLKSLTSEIRLIGGFASTSTPEDMNLEPSLASIRVLSDLGTKAPRTLIEELFAYELEPYWPPTPPPKPKAKIDKAAAAARRQARAAKYDGPRVAGRSTRHTVALGIDKLVEQAAGPIPSENERDNLDGRQLRTRDDDSIGKIAAGSKRIRLIKGKSKAPRENDTGHRASARGRDTGGLEAEKNAVSIGGSTSNESNATGSRDAARRSRPQRGVIGEESYSPLGPRERRERDKQMAMELVVENLDSRDDFKRFNVGWVLPEGTKRGGRRERQLDQVQAIAPKKRKSSKLTETSASTPSLAEARRSTDPVQYNAANVSLPPRVVSGRISSKADSKASSARPRSCSISSESSLSELSELNDVSETQDEPEAESSEQGLTNGAAEDAEGPIPGSSLPNSKRIRKRTSDMTPDYLVPQIKKRARLPSTLAHRARSSDKTTVVKSTTPTASELSSLSQEGDEHTKAREKHAPENEDEDHAEPDEDEERDERLASLRGTNGTTAVGKWIDPYPDGTLVWAQIKGFPYYPAEIVNAVTDYDEIKELVWKRKPKTGNERVWLVRFYDRTKSYAWVTQGFLSNLGDDQAVDDAFLNGKDKSGRGTFKTENTRKAVHKAYEDAKAEMEI